MSKDRRKKYNPRKRVQRITTAALRNTALVFIGGDENKVRFVHLTSQKCSQPTSTIVQALQNAKYTWSVLCAVTLRTQDNKEYIQSIEVESSAPEYQLDMTQTLNQHHNKLLKDCNQAHICTIAWLAVPYAHDWDLEKSVTTLNALGAWDFSAQWEITS